MLMPALNFECLKKHFVLLKLLDLRMQEILMCFVFRVFLGKNIDHRLKWISKEQYLLQTLPRTNSLAALLRAVPVHKRFLALGRCSCVQKKLAGGWAVVGETKKT